MSAENKDKNFPRGNMSYYRLNKEIEKRLNEIPSWNNTKKGFRLGFPQTKPHKSALIGFKKLLEANSNNIGDNNDDVDLVGTRAMEYEVIRSSAELFGDKNAKGYISTGGTESNIEAIWLIVNNFKLNRDKIALIKSPLTHYSIEKAASIMNLKTYDTSLFDNKMNVEDLCHLIKYLYTKRNFRGFIIVGTVGNVSTGTSDNIEDITKAIKKLNFKNKIKVAVHVDAAFGGLVAKFVGDNKKFDFTNRMVSTLTVDFHKMGMCPYPAGLFLCRQNLVHDIKMYNSYGNTTHDWMVSGSRSGASVASCWAAINSIGYDGYRKNAIRCIDMKEWLINQLLDKFPDIKIIKNNLNVAAVRFTGFDGERLSAYMEEKYRLYYTLINNEKWYKIYIMPHVKKKFLHEFLRDLENEYI